MNELQQDHYAEPFAVAGEFTITLFTLEESRARRIPVHADATLVGLLENDHGASIAMGFHDVAEFNEFIQTTSPRCVHCPDAVLRGELMRLCLKARGYTPNR